MCKSANNLGHAQRCLARPAHGEQRICMSKPLDKASVTCISCNMRLVCAPMTKTARLSQPPLSPAHMSLLTCRGLKETTGLVGLEVDPEARANLLTASEQVLAAVREKVPAEAQYRANVEATFEHWIDKVGPRNIRVDLMSRNCVVNVLAAVRKGAGRGALPCQCGQSRLRAPN